MHILNLGILQNVCAEGILWLMEHNVFCDGITAAADKLRLVFNEFKRYCKIHGVSCSQRTFTPANLHYATGADKQTDYPFLWPGLQTVGWHYEPSFMLIGPRPKTP